MPAIHVFGRRWLLAEDDLVLPAAVLGLFHFVWSVLLIVWLGTVHGPADCEGAWRYDLAVGGLLGAFVASCGLEAGVTAVSAQGATFERRRRRHLPLLLYLDCISHAAQVAFNGYGTYLITSVSPPVCPGPKPWDPSAAMK